MGRVKRTGLDGIAFTALASAITLFTQNQKAAAGVAGVIGIVALVASDHVKMKELGFTEEEIADISETAVDVGEDVADDIQSGGNQ